jgi:hypothetical protein
MHEEGKKVSAIRRELLQRYPNTKLPGPRAIQKWVSQKEEIQRAARSEDASMRNRIPSSMNNSRTLKQQVGLLPITSSARWHKKILTEKGGDALNLTNEHSSYKENYLKFGIAWLSKFKQVYGWRRRVVHGEASAAYERSVERGKKLLPQILASYDMGDVYNADEAALLHGQTPQKRIVNHISKATNAKKALHRLTVTLCINATGTHSIPPQVIIKSAGRKDRRPPRPQSLKDVNLHQLGVIYSWNSNAWMTSELFEQFLRVCKRQVLLKKGRKPDILLIDGFSGHKPPSDDCVSFDIGEGMRGFYWEFVTVIWLPPNTTSQIQPLDAGVINAFKVRSTQQQL